MINATITAGSGSVALAAIRPAAPAKSAPTASVLPALQGASPRGASGQDRVIFSPEAKRIADLVKGQAASSSARGAESSEAAYGASVQQRIKAILGARAASQTAVVSADSGREKLMASTAPTTTTTEPLVTAARDAKVPTE